MNYFGPPREQAPPHNRYVQVTNYSLPIVFAAYLIARQLGVVDLNVTGPEDQPHTPAEKTVSQPSLSQMNNDLTAVINGEKQSMQLEICQGSMNYLDGQNVENPIIVRNRDDTASTKSNQSAMLGHLTGEGMRITVQGITNPDPDFLERCLSRTPTYVEVLPYADNKGDTGLRTNDGVVVAHTTPVDY